MIALIVARDRLGAIGKENTIPWHAPEDLNFFQRETKGGAIIMGRKTWESLPFKPLKDRLNIVISRNDVEGVTTMRTLKDAISFAKSKAYFRIYGIGGRRVYDEILPLCDRMLITEVETEVDSPDTYFPEFDKSTWRVGSSALIRQAKPKCTVVEYLK